MIVALGAMRPDTWMVFAAPISIVERGALGTVVAWQTVFRLSPSADDRERHERIIVSSILRRETARTACG